MAARTFDPRGVWLHVPYPQVINQERHLEAFAKEGGTGLVCDTNWAESRGYVSQAVEIANRLSLQSLLRVSMPTPSTSPNLLYQEVRDSECTAVLIDRPRGDGASTTLGTGFAEVPTMDLGSHIDIWYSTLGGLSKLLLLPDLVEGQPEDLNRILTELVGLGAIQGSVYADQFSSYNPNINEELETRTEMFGGLPILLYWGTDSVVTGDGPAVENLLRNARAAAAAGVQGIVVDGRDYQDRENFFRLVRDLSNFPDDVPESAHIRPPWDAKRDSTANSEGVRVSPTNPIVANISTTPAAHRDTPIDCNTRDVNDTLGHLPYVSALYQLLSHKDTGLPISMAVSAPWGSGKTSIMRWLKCDMDAHRTGGAHTPYLLPNDADGRPLSDQQLELTRVFKTVWVDAWRYEDGPALWAALTKAVYEQCQQQIDDSAVGFGRLKFRLALANNLVAPESGVRDLGWRTIIRRMAGRYFRTWQPYAILTVVAASVISAVFTAVSESATGWLALTFPSFAALATSLGSIKGVIRQPFSFDLNRYASESAGVAPPSYSDKGAQEIARMIQLIAPGDNDAVAIFVDDLDRCSPNRVMDTLEAVNLLFNGSTLADNASSGKSAFVLGMDVDMVAASVRVAYRPMVGELRRRGNPAADDFGFRFLGKIVQLVFSIPTPSAERIAGLVDTLVDRQDDSSGDKPVDLPEPARQEYTEKYNVVKRETSDPESLAAKAAGIIKDAPGDLKAAVDKHVGDLFRTEVRERTRRDSADVREAIQYGSVLLEQRPRDLKRFVNAVRLQFLVMDQTLSADKERAHPKQVGKWTALVMRWPVLAEEIRWSPKLMADLETWARQDGFVPEGGWPQRVAEILENPFRSKPLRTALCDPPSLEGANLHGLLPVQ